MNPKDVPQGKGKKKRPKSEITPMFDTKYASNFHRI